MDGNDNLNESRQRSPDLLQANSSAQTQTLNLPQLLSTEPVGNVTFSQVPIIPATAAVYFCFEDDKFDKPENPNKIILAKANPTIQEFCATIKSLFYPNQDVTMTCSFNNPLNGEKQIFDEDSQFPVPTDRNNVVMIRVKYNDSPGQRLSLPIIQMTHWLMQLGNQLGMDMTDVITIFQHQKITLDSLRYLKESDLETFGVKEWGLRVQIMEAIQRHFSQVRLLSGLAQACEVAADNANQNGIPTAANTPSPSSIKRKFEEISPPSPDNSAKKFHLSAEKPKRKIRFKDLDELVNEPTIPVGIGSRVFCQGFEDKVGVVVHNKQKKAMIEYAGPDTKKKLLTIPQFFKAVTGNPLHAKGDSWSMIYFTDPQTGHARSLETLKYIYKGPKKAISAFLFFSKEIRDTLGKDLSNDEFAKRSGEAWKNLPDEQKRKYRLKEAQDRERYLKEKSEWHAINSQLEQQRAAFGTPISLNPATTLSQSQSPSQLQSQQFELPNLPSAMY